MALILIERRIGPQELGHTDGAGQGVAKIVGQDPDQMIFLLVERAQGLVLPGQLSVFQVNILLLSLYFLLLLLENPVLLPDAPGSLLHLGLELPGQSLLIGFLFLQLPDQPLLSDALFPFHQVHLVGQPQGEDHDFGNDAYLQVKQILGRNTAVFQKYDSTQYHRNYQGRRAGDIIMRNAITNTKQPDY